MRGLSRLAIILITLALAALPLIAAGRGAAPPRAPSPGLVLSEVYAPPGSTAGTQWAEVYNMRLGTPDAYALDGLRLGNRAISVTLATTQTVAANRYVLLVFDPAAYPARANRVVVGGFPGLDPQADMLALYSPSGRLIDQLNWGRPAQEWPQANAGLWNPGLAPLDRPTTSWGRTWPPGAPRDNDRPGDWTIHETVSPGGQVGPPEANNGLYLRDFTNVVGVLSGVLLWLGFIFVGVIAWRFQRLQETRTYWWFLVLAPSGILFYTIVVAIGFSQPGGALTDDQKWLSFPILAASAIACLVAVIIFQRVARGFLGGGDEG